MKLDTETVVLKKGPFDFFYLSDSPCSVPDKVKPLSFSALHLIHDSRSQVIHGHFQNWDGAKLMRQWLFLETTSTKRFFPQ